MLKKKGPRIRLPDRIRLLFFVRGDMLIISLSSPHPHGTSNITHAKILDPWDRPVEVNLDDVQNHHDQHQAPGMLVT